MVRRLTTGDVDYIRCRLAACLGGVDKIVDASKTRCRAVANMIAVLTKMNSQKHKTYETLSRTCICVLNES